MPNAIFWGKYSLLIMMIMENYLVEGYQLPQFPTEHLIWLYACFVHHPCGPGGDHNGHQEDDDVVGVGDCDDGNAVKLQM